MAELPTQSQVYSDCSICLFPYNDETQNKTECNHTFHQECINRWLETNNSCPLCRTVLYSDVVAPGVVAPDVVAPRFGTPVTYILLNYFGDYISSPLTVDVGRTDSIRYSNGRTDINPLLQIEQVPVLIYPSTLYPIHP